jgi:hypothetical protein
MCFKEYIAEIVVIAVEKVFRTFYTTCKVKSCVKCVQSRI